jgi:hypothetical protein
MSPLEYEIAFYAQTVWRLANSSDTNENLAVACAIRNHVIPKMGMASTYESYTEACLAFLQTHPLRNYPTKDDESFISRPEGLLFNIARIHSCEYPDITSTHDHPAGARYFARVTSLQDGDWRKTEIVGRPSAHCLLGTFGSMQFFE